MNVNAGPTASRQFVAHPPFLGAKVRLQNHARLAKQPRQVGHLMMVAGVLGFSVLLGALWLGVQSYVEGSAEWIQQFAGHGLRWGLLVSPCCGAPASGT